jgi:hypothetical protein
MRGLTFDNVENELNEWSIAFLLFTRRVFGLFDLHHAATHNLTVLPTLQASYRGHLEILLVQQGLNGGEDHWHDVVDHVVQL